MQITADWLAAYATGASALIALLALVLILAQLKRMASDRQDENHVAIITQVLAHNSRMLDNPHRRFALQIFLRDEIKPPKAHQNVASDAELYWATRDLHLSHQNLLASIWNLGGRVSPLPKRYNGFEPLRAQLLKELKNPPCEPLAYRQACHDLWAGMSSGSDPREDFFFKWFRGEGARK